jgi:hypothetical protein
MSVRSVFWIVLLAYVAGSSPALGEALSFSAPKSIVISTDPRAVINCMVAGDFTQDGRNDLVLLANGLSVATQLFLLQGNGDGTFLPRSEISTSSAVFKVNAAYLNGDERLDLAVLSLNDGLLVYFGQTSGELAAPVRVSIGASYSDIHLADIDGDRRMDLVVSDAVNSASRIYRGNGDGTFANPTVLSFSARLVQDFTGDRLPDIIGVKTPSSPMFTFVASGGGVYQERSQIASPFAIGALSAADFSGDNKVDLAISGIRVSDARTRLALLHGDGSGTFRYGTELPQFGGPLASADFNATIGAIWLLITRSLDRAKAVVLAG